MADGGARDPPSCSSDEHCLREIGDVETYSKKILNAIVQSIKCANNLPAEGDDFDYYSSFQGFRDLMDIEGKRILHIIQDIMKHQHVKGNICEDTGVGKDVEDKFDVVLDVNDQILERISNLLDDASDIKKNDTTLVVASFTPKQTNIASWNKKQSLGSGSKSYRLLAARNIQRPQLKFKEKVDNSNKPFIPLIRVKPNALRSLSESLKLPFVVSEAAEQLDFQYPHPYQYELDWFKTPQEQLIHVEPKELRVLDETPLTLIETREDLEKLCKNLKKEREIAVDTEHHSYRSFQGITCLIQISTRTQDYLIDVLELKSDAHLLNDVFTDPQIVKVFHGADHDVLWLQRDFSIYLVNLFDTGQAARVLNFARYSLSYVTETYCQKELNKQYQLADWRIRPLPEELMKYAREDTHNLLYIYDCMKNELLEKGNNQKNLLLSVIQRSTELCKKVYQKPLFRENDYNLLYKKSRKVFNSQHLYALKCIYEWRDKVARDEDESIGYVLPNHMMLQIAEILPREKQGILACCNPIPPLVRQYLIEIHNFVLEARKLPLVKIFLHRSIKPKVYQHHKYDADSFLNCPHDLSHQTEQSLEELEAATDYSLIAEKSSLFDEDRINGNVQMKLHPLLSVFDWSPKIEQKISKVQENVLKVKKGFLNPFDMYLPSVKENPATMCIDVKKTSGQGSGVLSQWTLMKNLKHGTSSTSFISEGPVHKRFKDSESDEDETMITVNGNNNTDVQDEENPTKQDDGIEIQQDDAIPICQLVPLKKKRKRARCAEAKGLCVKGVKFMEPDKLIDSDIEIIEPKKVKTKMQKRQKALTMEQVEAGFKPFDYSQTDLTIFDGKSTLQGKHFFNPYERHKSKKIKKGKKSTKKVPFKKQRK